MSINLKKKISNYYNPNIKYEVMENDNYTLNKNFDINKADRVFYSNLLAHGIQLKQPNKCLVIECPKEEKKIEEKPKLNINQKKLVKEIKSLIEFVDDETKANTLLERLSKLED